MTNAASIDEIIARFHSIAGSAPSGLCSRGAALEGHVAKMLEMLSAGHSGMLPTGKARLEEFHRYLNSPSVLSTPAHLDQAEAEFFILLETEPLLRTTYLAITERELVDLMATKLQRLHEVSKERSLTANEQEQSRKLEAMLAESRKAILASSLH